MTTTEGEMSALVQTEEGQQAREQESNVEKSIVLLLHKRPPSSHQCKVNALNSMQMGNIVTRQSALLVSVTDMNVDKGNVDKEQ